MAFEQIIAFVFLFGLIGIAALWVRDEVRFEREQREFFNRPGRRNPNT